jgi:phytoene dehydrogenase-like protein
MNDSEPFIVRGGLAGLSAGCHARTKNFDVTIVEHNLARGGACTAWRRGPYLIDVRSTGGMLSFTRRRSAKREPDELGYEGSANYCTIVSARSG